MKAIDITGQTYGLLTVLACASSAPRMWRCKCACGSMVLVPTGRLRSGNTRSCGCRKRKVLGESTTKHGAVGTPEYRVWKGMRLRCNNAAAKSYQNYGGRGITVCKRWDKFENFLADMGPRPTPQHTLERKRNNGGYSPSNCVWATRKEQALNTRRTKLVVVNGERTCVGYLADKHGVSRALAYARIKAGWGALAACSVPARGSVRGSAGKVVHISSATL